MYIILKMQEKYFDRVVYSIMLKIMHYNQQADLHVNNASMMTFNSIQCLTLFSTFPHITNINFN
ncbi:hypothetical protein T06_8236 [Trichinella sp. T6]|nr:hypothetical protein T06_8236 [Trichinella sp. T6]